MAFSLRLEKQQGIRQFLPAFVFILLMGLTFAVWHVWRGIETDRSRYTFEEDCNRYERDITEQLKQYNMLIQGGAGLFVSTDSVRREEWRTYYDFRRVNENFPGMEGLGYTKLLSRDELPKHVRTTREEGLRHYRVWPESERQILAPVYYMEPHSARNERLLGYDMYFEPVRKKAMDMAGRSRTTAMTSMVNLVLDEIQSSTTGFLLYAPVYETQKDGSFQSAAPIGFVFSPVRIDRMMEGVDLEPNERYCIQIYDGEEVAASRLMYASANPADEEPFFQETRTIDQFGHTWSIVIETRSGFGDVFPELLSFSIILAGLLISLFAALFVRAQVNTRDVAIEMANEMTVALRDSASRLTALFNNAPDAIILVGMNGKVQTVNPSAERMFGYPEGQMDGLLIEHLIPNRFKSHSKLRDEFLNDPETRPMREGRDVMALRKDGSEFPVEVMLSTIESGNETIAITTIRDVTDRMVALQKLGKEEARIEKIMNSVGEGIFEVDSEGRLTYINPQAMKLLGYDEEDLIGLSQHEILHHSKADGTPYPKEKCPIQLSLSDGLAQMVTDEVFWRKDGSYFTVGYTTTPVFDTDRSIRGAVVVFRDISERKRVEIERIARKSAEEASRAKSNFVANMSHEIRTPLNAIMGFTQILERDPALSSEQIKYVQTIHRSGAHLLTLINDILDMAKIEAGKTTLDPSAFNLHDFVDDLTNMFRSRSAAKGLQLIVEGDFGETEHVYADEAKLRQVLVNLIGNAVKFTDSGGVAVRMKTVALPDREDNGIQFIAEVEDSGPGIPEHEVELIFDAFNRASTGKSEGGTGLGLSISRRFIEMMGGSLSVRSELGKGSCFRFDVLLLPAEAIEREERQPGRRIIGIKNAERSYRILVADDMPDNRYLMLQLLLPVGFEVKEAVNGAQALEIFDEWTPDLILMDMRMPVMDGYEAVRLLRSTGEGRRISIIAVTASAFEDARKQVLATGVDAYLRKPFQPDDLLTMIAEYLEIEYTYEELEVKEKIPKPEFSEECSLDTIPDELADGMREAVETGDMNRMTELIESLGAIDMGVAARVQALVDRYDYEKILDLLDQRGESDD